MALLLPQCASPAECLHHQLTVRQRLSLRRSRRPTRATHGAAESSTTTNSTKAATDRFRNSGTEPCCNITSPLLMTPRITVRRSSRLRVRKGRWDDGTDVDMDSADWINRVLDKNGVVEVDPVTIAKQMQQEQQQTQTNSPNTSTTANYVSSADASGIYPPPRSSGFPSKVPLAVALAAGSAVALAAVAFLLKSLNKQGGDGAVASASSSDFEGSNLNTSFKGDPAAPNSSSSKASQTPAQGKSLGNKEALASAAAAVAGAAILQPGNVKERSSSSVPSSPPSVSKTGSPGERSQSPRDYASVTPFFTSARSSVSYSKPALPVPRWGKDKFNSVQPFFADEKAAVAPSNPEEQSSTQKSENSPSPSKTVIPFFTSARSSVSSSQPAPPVARWSEEKFKSVQPFFADEKAAVAPFIAEEQTNAQKSEKSPAPSKTVTPFFADEQQSSAKKSESSPAPSKTATALKSEKSSSPSKTVTPFFGDEQQSSTKKSENSSSPSKTVAPVSSWSEGNFKSVQPFFADDRAADALSIPEEQGSTKQSENSPSSSKTVIPSFSDEQLSSTKKNEKSPSPSKPVTPFFADEQLQSSTQKSEKSSSPSKSVTPFFTSARSSVSSSQPAPPVSRWSEDKFKSVQPFFAAEKAAVPPSIPEEQSSAQKIENSSSPSKTVTPFFADEQLQSSPQKSEKIPSPSKTVAPVSRWSEEEFKSVQPFFADDRAASVAPSIPEEQSSTQKSESSPSPSKTVTPFFADEQQQQSSEKGKGSVSLETVPPLFAVTEQQRSSNGPSVNTVTPFFADEQQQRKNGSSLENVVSFFADEQQQQQQGRGKTLDLENVKPFFSDDQVVLSEGKEMLAAMSAKPQEQHKEFRDGTTEEERAILEETKAEEARQQAKMQALQAAFPALAIGAGAVGALAGVDGALEMVGVTATASFISYELLWANKRKELLDEMSRITDHHKLFSFLQKRKIVKDDC